MNFHWLKFLARTDVRTDIVSTLRGSHRPKKQKDNKENIQENGFHIMLDETSPYIAGWFAATVLTLMLLKYIYLGQGLGEQGEAEVSSIMMLIIILLISFINVIMMFRPCTSTCFLW